MKSFLFSVIFVFAFYVFSAQVQSKVEVVKFEELEKRIQSEKDKTLVVNFWATTCAPCVKELPHFVEVNHENKSNPNFKMLLISLDRLKDMPKVLKFIKNKNITVEVILLDDVKRMNTWIPRFDKDWQGEMPVTILYQNGKKIHFQNGEMSKLELQNILTKYLK